MQKIIQESNNKDLEEKISGWELSDDYSLILDTFWLAYRPDGYYWQVGEITGTQGWILHLSVIRAQFKDLLQKVIPLLTEEALGFKIVRDFHTAGLLIEGNLGYHNVGKMISIYPVEQQLTVPLIQKLISLTKAFRGPAIPTDRHLGGVVYTRYGSFNPVMIPGEAGTLVKCIYDQSGQLMPDPYYIPFKFPTGLAWPFTEIASPDIPPPAKLLNHAYYPLFIIKPDAKGNVIRALYFKRPWLIRSCLIKQGRKNMFSDENGRDIQDRLQWQYDLYQQLKNDLPLPEVFDYFSQADDTYLAMEFIKGESLSNWLMDVYQDRSWLTLAQADRIKILDRLNDTLSIIRRLHQKGYIHRDITPENFLIDEYDHIWMIDMELTWHMHTECPAPPFKLGTAGFMSREQQECRIPTEKEDIYGLGALMLVCLTNLFPVKLNLLSSDHLKEQLLFFIGDDMIASLITACMNDDPAQRPSLPIVQKTVQQYREKQRLGIPSSPSIIQQSPDNKVIQRVVQYALNSLAQQQVIDERQRWISKMQKKERFIGNYQLDVALYEGWHTGMAGPLWLMARAELAEFDTTACMAAYNSSWGYIQEHYFQNAKTASQSLFAGGPGIAWALTEGLKSKLLTNRQVSAEQLAQCFASANSSLHLSDGIAGAGLALLHITPWMERQLANELLQGCITGVLNRQNKDGSWDLFTSRKRDGILTGMDAGVAGIVWFLLACLQQQEDHRIKMAATKGLSWLIRHARKNKHAYYWSLSSKSSKEEKWACNHGIPGISLVFIKAYELFKEPIYRELAENSLLNHSAYPILYNFTQTGGMAGLGEIYLEAHRVFNTIEWRKRADWIALALMHCFNEVGGQMGYWLPDQTSIVTADLFTGTSGILHFLIRYLQPAIFNHPLSPDITSV